MNRIIRDHCNGKLSGVVRHMINGIKRYKDNPQFVLTMATYGKPNNEGTLCYGCAATCALMDATGVFFSPEAYSCPRESWHVTHRECRLMFLKKQGLSFVPSELVDFEYLVDTIRLGGLIAAWGSYELHRLEIGDLDEIKATDPPKVTLHEDNLEETLPMYEEWADRLEAVGL